MKKAIFLVSVMILSSALWAQPFKPYHALGVQVNANYTLLNTEWVGSFDARGVELGEGSLKIDLLASYDYGIMKWLGVSSGIGFSIRGGSAGYYTKTKRRRRDIYYLNIPVKLQLKPFKFFWIEPGIENKILLGHTDIGFPEPKPHRYRPFDPDHLNTYDITALMVLRFNLLKKLSLSIGYHQALTHTAFVTSELSSAVTTYEDRGIRIGIRYMFVGGE